MERPDSLIALQSVSARLGADPMLIQGPGGNTSIKADGRLWVKASGCWLADAMDRPMFTPLWLDQVRDRLQAGYGDDLAPCIDRERCDPDLRPSIETALHAVLPQAVVVHAHAINCVTASVLRDGEAMVRSKLGDRFAWDWVPYHRPGAPLARSIAELTARRTPDVLILQNHGVVVGAASPEEAAQLLRAVEDALSFPVRTAPLADVRPIQRLQDQAFEACEDLSDIALDQPRLIIITDGSLVPDQVALLGGPIPTLSAEDCIAGAAERIGRVNGVTPSFVCVPGVGVLGRRGRSAAADLLMRALVEVVRRVPDGAPTTSLPAPAVMELAGWDAEHHRQSLNRGQHHA